VLQKAVNQKPVNQKPVNQKPVNQKPANNTETGKEDSCRILTKGGENIRLPIE